MAMIGRILRTWYDSKTDEHGRKERASSTGEPIEREPMEIDMRSNEEDHRDRMGGPV